MTQVPAPAAKRLRLARVWHGRMAQLPSKAIAHPEGEMAERLKAHAWKACIR